MAEEPTGGPGEVDLGAPMDRWVEQARVVEHRRRRRREAALRDQLAAGPSLRATVIGLAERRSFACVSLIGGGHINGRVEAVGRDFCTMANEQGHSVVRLDVIAAIESDQRAGAADIDTGSTVDFVDVLASLADDQEPVSVHLTLAPGRRGIVDLVGTDVFVLDVGGRGTGGITVPVTAVTMIQWRR